MAPLEAIQRSRNRESADAWRLYQPHRHRVTSLIRDALPAEGEHSARICLLGAGNCNDVDLGELASRCSEVLLVDLDDEALQQAVARQQLAGHPAIRFQANTDVTGMFDRLNPDTAATVGDQSLEIAELTRATNTFSANELPDGFDLVASVCLLSQLVDGVIRRIPDPHTALPLLQALRRRHLRLLLEKCRPGGQAILFSEVVSSDTCPNLANTPDETLPELLAQLLATQNFFTGLHPGVILQEPRSDPQLTQLVGKIKPIAPWKWPFICRTYAVTAFVVERCE